MSDAILRLISVDPFFVPAADRCQAARDQLAAFYSGKVEISAKVSPHIRFIDPGDNLSRVSCPNCKATLNREWWQAAMENAYHSNFVDMAIQLPCCGMSSTLNDLQYEWPAGFARFVLEARNPGSSPPQDELDSLSQVLGCPLRAIWAHY
jgi:hypothetical protein